MQITRPKFLAFTQIDGRVTRVTWIYKLFTSAIFCIAFGMFAYQIAGESAAALFSVLFLWSAISISIRRLHDTGKSGKQILWFLLPVFGPLWLLLRLLRAGNKAPNSYGQHPRPSLDYRAVNITRETSHVGYYPCVNDVTQINPIEVLGIVSPDSVTSLQYLLKNSNLPVSIGGGHFSMGGHTASLGSVHIDLRRMNHVLHFDPEHKIIKVESGIRWCDIQKLVDPHGLSVKIMQTYANFTVGGALSVNAHGRYMGLGPVVLSVRSIGLLLCDGTLVEASPLVNQELFYGAIGGYGGIGIIAEVELELVANARVERAQLKMKTVDYLDWFKKNMQQNNKAIFHNADLYPPHYIQARAVTWSETDKPVTTKHRLQQLRLAYPLELYFLWAISETPLGKFRREYFIDPLLYFRQKIHWRNYEAGYDTAELEPLARTNSTYVLQEYFLPYERIMEFIPKMAAILSHHRVNILNISIRHALPDPGTLLAWARGETFALVLYYKQRTSADAREIVGIWTRELVDAVIECGGGYYLPYQLHATHEQFMKAYPGAGKLFELKRKLDPNYRLRGALWDKYYRPLGKAGAPEEAKSSLFHKVYGNVRDADRFYAFLKNIFHLYPPDRFHVLIKQLVTTNNNDKVIYQRIQDQLPSITPKLSLLTYALPSLVVQKKEMGVQTANLLGANTPLLDYVEIGSTGRYVKTLKKCLSLKGSITLVHDKAPTNSIVDIVERGQLPNKAKFVPLNNYNPIGLPSNSADLVSCYVGLHHMSIEKRKPFIESIASITRQGGYFILRDHDVKDTQMNAFVSLAHCVFNAGTGETWETNATELRHFESIQTWINLIEESGFLHIGENLLQAGDPTNNMLLAFKRVSL